MPGKQERELMRALGATPRFTAHWILVSSELPPASNRETASMRQGLVAFREDGAARGAEPLAA